MLWDLHVNGFEVDAELKDHADRRLSFALSRFGTGVLKTAVYLTDNNGPKGGFDKNCLIVVRLRGLGEVVAEVVDTEWPVAIDRATTRIGHNVRRAIERKRAFSHEPMAG